MLYYPTEDPKKVELAERVLRPMSIHFETKKIDLIEPQSDSIEEVVMSLAKQAFEKLGHPVFIYDAGWFITSLRGFPGPLMKYMNEWLTNEDFLNLMKPYENKEVIFKEAICYVDKDQTKLFKHQTKGEFLEEYAGVGLPSEEVITMVPNGKSIAEVQMEGTRIPGDYSVWLEFGSWLKKIA